MGHDELKALIREVVKEVISEVKPQRERLTSGMIKGKNYERV